MKNSSPLSKRTIAVALTLPVLFVVLLLVGVAIPAQAQTPTILHSFLNGGTDACVPEGNIVQGRDGNMWGIGDSCGTGGGGAVYKISPTGTESVVISFAPIGWGSCFSGLTLGSDGNFYGTCFTTPGGNGSIFQLTPAGVFTDKHDFTNTNGDTEPEYAPVQATDGNFYGVTGDYPFSCGNIYKLTSAGVYTSLHTFSGSDCGTASSLFQASDGNLYGTLNTCSINATGLGCVYKISTAGVFKEIFGFPTSAGYRPCTGVIQGKDGKLYGATSQGAANGIGNIYKLTTAGVQTDFHDFNNTTDAECGNNVARTNVNLLQVTDGNFYGVNGLGGPTGGGSIYKLTSAGVFTAFLFPNPTVDGNFPASTLLQNTNGTVYGTTPSGGPTSCNPCQGVFFSVATGDAPFALLQETSGKVGSKIGILGQGFSASSVVKFHGVTATTVTRNGTTFLLATVPTGATDGFVTVTTGATTLTSSKTFVVHNSWSTGAPMPVAAVAACSAVLNGQMYVVGGYNASAQTAVQIYNPTTNKWSTGTALASGLSNQACAAVNGEVYEFGGTPNTGGSQTNAVLAYNPATKAWSSKSAMPTARQDIVAVVANNLVYVIGGYNGNRVSTVEAYNPATDTWSTESSVLVAQSGEVGGVVAGNIVISGGAGQSADTGDTESYSVSGNAWTSLKADATVRNNPCGGVVGAALYVAGGANRAGSSFTVNEVFTPSKDAWTTLAPLPQATTDPASAVSGGQLFCFGGFTGLGGATLNNVQIYQP